MAIEGFRHKGLRQFFEQADARGIPTEHARKIRRVLTLLNAIESPAEFAMFPGLRAHALKGDLGGFWSVTITGNRRIIFRFEEGGAFDVDLLDYH